MPRPEDALLADADVAELVEQLLPRNALTTYSSQHSEQESIKVSYGSTTWS